MAKKMDKISSDDDLLLFGAEMAGSSIPALDLHGKRTFEIEEELDQFLSSEFFSGSQAVRIIHGFGTGALKNTINKFLSNHPLVRFFRTSRDGGSAIVILEDRD